MTGPERSDLRVALELLRDWRNDDQVWKEQTDRRLASLEDRFVASDAVAAAMEKRDADRARIWGLIGSVIGGGAMLVAQFFFSR